MKRTGLFRAAGAILLVAVCATLRAQRVAPDSPIYKWVSSAREHAGWTSVSYEDSGWLPIKPREEAPFPTHVIDKDGGVHEPGDGGRLTQLERTFLPFWHPTGGADGEWVYFRRPFQFTEGFAGCSTYLSVDDEFIFYVNGARLGGGSRNRTMGRDAREFDIKPYLKAGKNVLAIAARGPEDLRHVVAWSDLHQQWPVRAGQPMGWLCSLKAPSGWERPEFDPRGWIPAVPTAFGPNSTRGQIDTIPVWHPGDPDKQRIVYFRLPFTIEGVPLAGSVQIMVDNAYELYVNGRFAAIEKRAFLPMNPHDVDITTLLRPGRNVIAVKAYNYGGPAALACVPKVKVTF